MKKLLFTAAAIGCFVFSFLPAFAQWTTVTGGINYSAGKVGIGNATPLGMLHFGSAANNRKIVLSSATGVNNDHEFFGLGTTLDVFRFQIPGATRAYRFFRSDATTTTISSVELFTILGTGNVGIGNAAPTGLLSFANPHQNRKMVLWQTDDNDHEYYGLGTNPDVLRFQIPGAGRAFRFYRANGTSSSTEIFTILGTGSVCIGTPSPGSYKLAVGGKIGAWEEIKVLNPSTAFPDYVFAPSYKLRSLAEVESYIQQNQHLPEVPSAAVVEQQGMGLVEMNTIAIRKIEELTLYLIEQNKRLERQERMLEALQQQNQALKAENEQIKAAIEGLK